jgi:glycosyltransferase involved in cell wall biosynthesis
VVRFYRACDVFVAPFRGEAFGVKVLDALACGLPVIAPRYGGPADYLHDGNCIPVGYREVPVGDCLDTRLLALGNAPVWCEVDVQDLATKMSAVCRDLAGARRRAEFVRREAFERYAWPRIGAQLAAVISRLGGAA